jgi:predicted Holliday junction resolvase-like endonuclease
LLHILLLSFGLITLYLLNKNHTYKIKIHSLDHTISELNDKVSYLDESLTSTLREYSTLNNNYYECATQLKSKIEENSELNVKIATLATDLQSMEITHQNDLDSAIQDARKDTLKRSRSILRGQASEHLAPFVIEDTNPKDYRFMGNPIDYICFDGLSDVLDGQSDSIKTVRFVDIKTGKSNLNKSQRRIRDAIKDGRVTFEIVNLDEVMKIDKTLKELETQSTE